MYMSSATVYVGSERWGRGLDLDVKYVFLLGPPSSTAGYAHLAGRTGRRGRDGTAVTIEYGVRWESRDIAVVEIVGILQPDGKATPNRTDAEDERWCEEICADRDLLDAGIDHD